MANQRYAEYRPGQVWLVHYGDGEDFLAVYYHKGWIELSTGRCRFFVTPLRPLALIDPEDGITVERLRRSAARDKLRTELINIAQPVVKPEEPQGLGAVVAVSDVKWVSAFSKSGSPVWRRAESHYTFTCKWDDFPDTVKVLSQGLVDSQDGGVSR